MMVEHKVSNGFNLRHRKIISAAVAAGLVGFLMAHSAVKGAVSLSDNASASAYPSGAWPVLSNGSTNGVAGLGPWYQGPAGSGVGQAATWGFFTGPSQYIYGTTANATIDTAGVSWGIYANNGSGSDPAAPYAYRGFTPMTASSGNTSSFSLGMVTGPMSNPGQEGFQLQSYNAASGYATPIFQIAATGSGNYYTFSYGGYTAANPGFTNSVSTGIKSVNDGSGSQNDGSGIVVTFTLKSSTSFDVSVAPVNSAQGATFDSGLLTGLNNLPISQLMVYNNNAGLASQYDYFNSLRITEPNATPEPAALLLMTVAAGGALLVGRRDWRLRRRVDRA